MKVDDYDIENLSLYPDSELVEVRRLAREDKNWVIADKIRDYLDGRAVIIMDTPEGEVVYYELDGTTRKDVIARINKNKRLDAMVDAWIYTVKSSVKLP